MTKEKFLKAVKKFMADKNAKYGHDLYFDEHGLIQCVRCDFRALPNSVVFGAGDSVRFGLQPVEKGREQCDRRKRNSGFLEFSKPIK